MSRIVETLKNKNRVEKLVRSKRNEELTRLKIDAAYKAKLYDSVRHLGALFSLDEIEAVVIEVKQKYITKFTAAIYTGELSEYEIVQSDTNPNQFTIKRKYILF